ncbi:phage tail protein [Methylophaga sp.]|uniref:phage tail protein n=1 Tax=Methylophaga sp. TaxID=2024840 RepID=UPI003A8E33BB
MTTFTFKPVMPATLTKEPRVRETNFGDGYSQRVADGINTNKRVWSLNFAGTQAEIEAIDDFLTSAGGVTSFDWLPPRGEAGKFTCKSWSSPIQGFNYWMMTATFDEVFGE